MEDIDIENFAFNDFATVSYTTATTGIFRGLWKYEVELLALPPDSEVQFGWRQGPSEGSNPPLWPSTAGTGDVSRSWAADGARAIALSAGDESNFTGRTWRVGDTVAVVVDTTHMELWIGVQGPSEGTAEWTKACFRCAFGDSKLIPSFTAGRGVVVAVNLGGDPFAIKSNPPTLRGGDRQHHDDAVAVDNPSGHMPTTHGGRVFGSALNPPTTNEAFAAGSQSDTIHSEASAAPDGFAFVVASAKSRHPGHWPEVIADLAKTYVGEGRTEDGGETLAPLPIRPRATRAPPPLPPLPSPPLPSPPLPSAGGCCTNGTRWRSMRLASKPS